MLGFKQFLDEAIQRPQKSFDFAKKKPFKPKNTTPKAVKVQAPVKQTALDRHAAAVKKAVANVHKFTSNPVGQVKKRVVNTAKDAVGYSAVKRVVNKVGGDVKHLKKKVDGVRNDFNRVANGQLPSKPKKPNNARRVPR